MTLGSLFSGSGGFELSGILSGITPIWNAEVEPFCIRVTTKRLPDVKHYGDVSTLSGAEIEPVDIITWGSPCQDLSIAGKRAGLAGARSGLFYEAIRIVKEMREATDGRYPKFIVWENVPGAFSSNKGEDFRCVLEAICRIRESEINIPGFKKWSNAGEIMADDFSLAWRVLDARYFGVPQRRRRIYLVGDLDGSRAGKILFESDSLSGDTEKGEETGKGTSGNIKKSSGASGIGFDRYNGDLTYDVAQSLTASAGNSGNNQPLVFQTVLNDQGGSRLDITEGITGTLRAEMGGHPPCVISSAGFSAESGSHTRGIGYEEETSPTLRARAIPAAAFVKGTRPHSPDEGQEWKKSDTANTLNTFDTGEARCNELVVYGIGGYNSEGMLSDNPHSGIYEAETSRTLDANGGNPSCNQGGMAVVCTMAHHDWKLVGDGDKANCLSATDSKNPQAVVYTTSRQDFHTVASEDTAFSLLASDYKGAPTILEEPYIMVRRLTPKECARLQGFPSWWCDGLGTENPTEDDLIFWRDVFQTYARLNNKKARTDAQIIKWLKDPYSDSAEYRMWGNAIALPCGAYVLSGIARFA